MPELPEVEYARRHLEKWTLGRTIDHAAAPLSRVLRPMSASSFVQKLKGRTVRFVERRGKWLRITLDDGKKLFSHLGMSGKWIARSASDETQRSEKLRLHFKTKQPETVRLVDPRMFGRLVISVDDIPQWTELGPDPIETPIDVKRLKGALEGSKRTIKEKLLDQSLLAGIGNIYATEALWKAKIDPRSRAGALALPQLKALAGGIKWTLERSLKSQGKGEIVYLEEDRRTNPFTIYGRGGEACPRCKHHPLAKIVLGGRGTVFCPNCQTRYGTETVTRARKPAPARKLRAKTAKSSAAE